MDRDRRCTRTLLLLTTVVILLASCSLMPPAELPQGYAIIYGVSDYSGSAFDLNWGDADANDLEALLQANGYQVTKRINAFATRAQLISDFATVADTIRANEGADSRFIFFFAGHGYGDGMESANAAAWPPEWIQYFEDQQGSGEPAGGEFTEYLLLHNATSLMESISSTSDVEAVLSESASDDLLSELLATIPSSMKTVIIDACHSGGFRGSGSSVDSIPENYEGWFDGVSGTDSLNAFSLYLEYGSREIDISEREAVVISAAGEREYSYESSTLENGVFTHYFLQAIETADRNFDGFITASEAYHHARARIAADWNDDTFSDFNFHPRVTGGAVDFVLFPAR